MIADAVTESKQPSDEPDFSKFADRDFTEGVEMDDSQEWIRELLEERVRRIDAGEEKSYTVEETIQWLEEYKREHRRKKS